MVGMFNMHFWTYEYHLQMKWVWLMLKSVTYVHFGNFTNVVFTNENITSSQVSMYNLIGKRVKERNFSSKGTGNSVSRWRMCERERGLCYQMPRIPQDV